MKTTFSLFLAAVAMLGAIVWLTAGRHQQKSPATAGLEELAGQADRGDAAAALEVARRYGFGIKGLAQDWSEARTWAGKAAESGSGEARLAVAAMQARGLGGTSDPEAGLEALRQAEAAGSAEAAYALGALQLEDAAPGGRAEGLARIRKAAKAGFSRAQYRLGMLARTGSESLGIEPDEGEAMRLLELAAKQADPDACGELGRGYLEHGSGGRDFQEAYAWLRTAMDTNRRWKPLVTEARRRLSSWQERDYDSAVTFSRREYGAGKFRGSLAALAAETKPPF